MLTQLPTEAGDAKRTAAPVAPPWNATLVGRTRLTDAVDVLHVRPDHWPFEFQAGQYVALGLAGAGGMLLRPYSPANLPGDGRRILELLIRHVRGGQLTTRLWAMPVGGRVHLGRAKGLFRLVPGDRRAHLFLATGTGIAPMVSMIASLLARSDPPAITVIHGVRHPAELAFRGRLEAWAAERGSVTYLPALSGPVEADQSADEMRGRLPDLLPRIWTTLRLAPPTTVAYLCGNPNVVDVASQFLASVGVEPAAIRREEYWPSESKG